MTRMTGSDCAVMCNLINTLTPMVTCLAWLQVVGATGAVVVPYFSHPQLLQTMLAALQRGGKTTDGLRLEVGRGSCICFYFGRSVLVYFGSRLFRRHFIGLFVVG